MAATVGSYDDRDRDRAAVSSQHAGFTLIEMVIVVAIVGLLASAAMPLARWSVKRGKEHELQQNLRILRNAIDRYHDAALAGLIEVEEGSSGYPPTLDVLVEGVELIGQMPPVVPPVSDEYGATGPGLTGGLRAQLQAGQEQGGAPGLGASQNSPAGVRGAAGGAFQPGGDNAFGARAIQGQPSPSIFGNRSRAGSPQTPGGAGRPGASALGFGSGGLGLRPGGGGLNGEQAPAEPILGPDGKPIKLTLLRRLPFDPFTGKAEWGRRCYGEPPQDRMWCGGDVFDVYSKSFAKAIDGTNYKDW